MALLTRDFSSMGVKSHLKSCDVWLLVPALRMGEEGETEACMAL